MLGQANHFFNDAPVQEPYATKRFEDETHRLYRVLNTQLTGKAYVAGDDYSIADIAIFGWANRYHRHRIDLEEFPEVKRWYESVLHRPAVEKALAIKVDTPQVNLATDQEARKVLFNQL